MRQWKDIMKKGSITLGGKDIMKKRSITLGGRE